MGLNKQTLNELKYYFLSRKGRSTVGGDITPDTTEAYNLGSATKRFDTIYARVVTADSLTGGATSDTVDGFHAYSTPQPSALLALDASSVYPDSVYPNAVLRDGTRAMTGNLNMGSQAITNVSTVDGVDVSAHAADGNIHHLSGLTADDHTQYAHSDGSGTRRAYEAQRLNKNVTAGDGLTGGGLMTADRTLSILLRTPSGMVVDPTGLALDDAIAGAGLTISSKVLAVGAGNGITVNANDVALTTPGTLSNSSTNTSVENHTHAITTNYDVTAGGTSILRSNTGNLYLAGLGVGINTLSAAAHVYGTGPQLRLDRGGGMYSDFTVDTLGTLLVQAVENVKVAPTGSVTFDPTGNDVRPENNYDLNLGLINKKWLTLHAAELWVETLVAQDTMATIGGRILVGPTTTIEEDFGTGVYTFLVKHNSFAAGDIVYLEADGKVEFITIGSLAIAAVNISLERFTISGDYTAYFTNGVKFTIQGSTGNNGEWTVSSSSFGAGFTQINVVEDVTDATVDGYILYTGAQTVGPYRFFGLTRNMDTSGENQWYAGDAVFNTGQAGNGFIDLYSLRGVSAASTSGPTIVGNVRTGATYNAWKEHWAIGNLKGIYGYGTNTYGLGAGRYEDGYSYLTVDDTNGFSIYRNVSSQVLLGRWAIDGTITIGDTGNEHVRITSTAFQVKDGVNVYTDLTGGVLTLGLVSGGEYVTVDGTNGISMYSNAQLWTQLTNAGVLTLGYAAGGEYVQVSSTGISLYGGGVQHGAITSAGTVWFGDTSTTERLQWDTTNGLNIYNASNVAVIKFPTSGDAQILGTLTVTNPGKITVGSEAGGIIMDTTSFRMYGAETTSWMKFHRNISPYDQIGSLWAYQKTSTTGPNLVLQVNNISTYHPTLNLKATTSWGDSVAATFLAGTTAQLYIFLNDNSTTKEFSFKTTGLEGPSFNVIYGGVQVGDISASDTTWLKINLNTAKNIYTSRYFRADGGLAAGAVTPGAGQVYASGAIRSDTGFNRSGVGGYIFVPYSATTYVEVFNQSCADGVWNTVDFTTWVPDGALGVVVNMLISPSAAGTNALLKYYGGSNYHLTARGVVAGQYNENQGFCATDSLGRCQVQASGGTATIIIRLIGYYY